MSKLSFVLLLVFLVQGTVVWAPAATVTFPTGDASWTADITDEPPPIPQVPVAHPRHVEVTQLNHVKRIVITWSDGKVSEKWSIPGLPVTFEEDPRNNAVVPFQNGSLRSMMYNFFLTYDISAFDWVTPDLQKEKDPISYQGKQCYHYIGSFTPPMQKFVVKKEAWIDAGTLLPVALDTGSALTTYKFSEKPPEGPLVMPASFKEAVKYYKVSMGYR